MHNSRRAKNTEDFEATIKEFIRQGRQKLEDDLTGTREAIKLVAADKTREFIRQMDKGLDRSERECLTDIIVASMFQAFCYGYGIGKLEGKRSTTIYL